MFPTRRCTKIASDPVDGPGREPHGTSPRVRSTFRDGDVRNLLARPCGAGPTRSVVSACDRGATVPTAVRAHAERFLLPLHPLERPGHQDPGVLPSTEMSAKRPPSLAHDPRSLLTARAHLPPLAPRTDRLGVLPVHVGITPWRGAEPAPEAVTTMAVYSPHDDRRRAATRRTQ